MSIFDITTAFANIGILVAITNIITEVLKRILPQKFPTNILVVIIAQTLTVTSGIAYYTHNSNQISWYIIIGFVVIGFLVSYSAMFGFDKLKQVIDKNRG